MFESRGDGSMLAEVGKKWRKKFWTSTRSRTAKERLTEVEDPSWNGDVYEEAGSTEYENGETTAGQESSPCSKSTTCRTLQSNA